MRVAIVHDWLYVLGGAEKVLAGLLRCFPSADVFCLFDILAPEDRKRLGVGATTTSFLQRAPGISKHHRSYLPLMPLAIEQFDLSAYDVIISSSYGVAKGVLTGPDQLHISYVHSPMRYAWDMQHEYLRESRRERGVAGWAARLLLHRMRLWDVRTAHGVDAYVANSHFVARRIRKAYGRDATVIPPPVAVAPALPAATRQDYFLAASRLVPYKNIRSIVEAFRSLPQQRLVVAGDGPERARLQAIAGPNVSFAGFVTDAELRTLMREARAFIFAAEEDFGIIPVEVQGEGTPVLALGRGGARETVISAGASPTGLFFDRADPESIAETIGDFLAVEERFNRATCHRNALRFTEAIFDRRITEFVAQQHAAFVVRRDSGCATKAQLLETKTAPSHQGTSVGAAPAMTSPALRSGAHPWGYCPNTESR